MKPPAKRKRGRPPFGAVFTIQKHVFLDQETADKLVALAKAAKLSESALVRELIQKEAKEWDL